MLYRAVGSNLGVVRQKRKWTVSKVLICGVKHRANFLGVCVQDTPRESRSSEGSMLANQSADATISL